MEEMLKKAEESYVDRRLASIRLEEAKGKARQEQLGFERDWAGIQNEIEKKKWGSIKSELQTYKKEFDGVKRSGKEQSDVKMCRRDKESSKVSKEKPIAVPPLTTNRPLKQPGPRRWLKLSKIPPNGWSSWKETSKRPRGH